jgi:hypothetical protein
MSFDKPPVNKVEQKKTPEERDQIYKKLLEELKVKCPTFNSFYKEIHNEKSRGGRHGLGAKPNPVYLCRAFSSVLFSIQERFELPYKYRDTISLPLEEFKTCQKLNQIVCGMAAEVYFGQNNIINEDGEIDYLDRKFANTFSNDLKS